MTLAPHDISITLSDPLGDCMPLLLRAGELHVAGERIRLSDVTRVIPVVRPSRLETRRWVQIAAAGVALFAGVTATIIGATPSAALAVGLVVMLVGVLGSDWMEERFPTPGAYSVELSLHGRRVVIPGLRSEHATQHLHERIAAAVRTAQGLNA